MWSWFSERFEEQQSTSVIRAGAAEDLDNTHPDELLAQAIKPGFRHVQLTSIQFSGHLGLSSGT
jgi:hypothetical protein